MSDTLTVEELAGALSSTGVEVTPGRSQDAVAGVTAAVVARPADTAGTSAVLKVAAERGWRVVARGTGTKLRWGAAPERVDVLLDTSGMARLLEHAAGDLVVNVQAGIGLDAVQAAVGEAGQRLALDPLVGPEAAGPGTIGGVIATGASGPLRLSHGSVRDLLIGVTVVRADGLVARAGGKVVKNVAGYDLGKLFTGSFGTLGVITEAIFRLHPLPRTTRWVVHRAPNAAKAHDAVMALVHSQLVPTAIEIDRPWDGRTTVAVSLEGAEAGVEARVAGAQAVVGGGEVHESAPPWWGRPVWEPGGTALRLTSELAGVAPLLAALDGVGMPVAVRGSAGVGVLHAALPADAEPDAVAHALAQLRQQSSRWGGDVVVLDAPAPVRERVDMWGPVRGLALMRRIKEQFDRERLLAPGRFVGGI